MRAWLKQHWKQGILLIITGVVSPIVVNEYTGCAQEKVPNLAIQIASTPVDTVEARAIESGTSYNLRDFEVIHKVTVRVENSGDTTIEAADYSERLGFYVEGARIGNVLPGESQPDQLRPMFIMSGYPGIEIEETMMNAGDHYSFTVYVGNTLLGQHPLRLISGRVVGVKDIKAVYLNL
jgi:hypothetical protein